MASAKELINSVIALADKAAGLVPGAGVISQGVSIAQKVIAIIDDLREDASVDQQGELQLARKKLSDAVKAKAAATADRLRGA